MTASNYFVPGNKTIVNIIRGRVTRIFTDVHGYTSGLVVRIVIPKFSGIQQLNDTLYEIYVATPNSFIIGVDSSNFDPFILQGFPRSNWHFVPQVIPVGDLGTGFEDASLNNNNIIPEIYPPPPYPAHP